MSDDKNINIRGIHLLTTGNGPTARIIVRVETDDGWRDAIVEHANVVESTVSHIVEPNGIRSSPRSPW